MRSEWSRLTLGEIANITSSKRIYAREYVDFGVPFYRSKEIIEKSNNQPISTPLFISRDRFDELCIEHGMPKQGDILLTSVGTLGVPYLVKDEEFYFKDGNLTWFQVDSTTSSEFLYYWLLSPEAIMQIDTKHIGSTQKALPIRILNKFKVTYPPFPVQEAIAYTLSCLDKKIELNNKINENLEQQAQTIFKSWFVDFEPFQDGKFVESELGMIPEGWGVRSLDEIAEYTNGLAMQRYWPENDEPGLPVLKIRELRQQFPDINSDRCTENIEEKFIVYDGDVIFSWSGSLLVDLWTGGKAGLNQHLFKVTSEKFPKWFYYYWTKYHLERFQYIAKSRATTMGHITRGHLREAKVLIPPKQVLGSITTLMDKILKMKINLRLENNTLANLRDTLLPKLMSGEIEVPVE